MTRPFATVAVIAGLCLASCGTTTVGTAPVTTPASATQAGSTLTAEPSIGLEPTAATPAAIPTESPATSETPAPTASPAATPAPAVTAGSGPTPRPKPIPSVSLKPGQTPYPSPMDIGTFLTGRISVLSLGDTALDVKVTFTDPDSGEGGEVASFTLNTLDLDAEPVLPGTYLVTFSRAPASSAPISCTLHVKDGDSFSFVATDQRILILKDGKLAPKRAEQIVGTSSMCAA
jgi:hypothetical protein